MLELSLILYRVKENNMKTHAQIAYEKYVKHMNGVTIDGLFMPPWEALDPKKSLSNKAKNAWFRAVNTITAEEDV